ncbi:MAG: hypothetical protein KF799_03495 [Bdellovibrionales bacterium]|nr:hypothetical protein [Bdellovibrionales bacterium]
MRLFSIALLFLAAVGFANHLTTRSWGGAVYVYVGERRAPASVRSVSDYSAIDRRALYRSIHGQLMSTAGASIRDGVVGVRLGHPLIPREEGGGREFACPIAGHVGVYDRVELTFYGTGITASGESPLLIIDNGCQASAQLDTLDTVWIPMQKIIALGPKDQELETDTQPPMYIRLQNIPGEWPENWVLTGVRFYRSDSEDRGMSLDADKLKADAATASMLSFEWKVKR